MKINLTKLGIGLVLIGLLFNVIETAYFGFNETAMSRPEEVCDVISKMLLNSGLILLIVTFLTSKKVS